MAMIGLAADYAGGRPSGAGLRRAGITIVMRYVGIGGGATLPYKRLTQAEYDDLTANGITVLAAVEATTTDADGGYAAGATNATAARDDVNTITRGAGLAAIFAVNDKPDYIPADVDYVRAFRDVLGVNTTGVYGFASFLTAVRTAGVASWYWQAGYPPSLTGTAGWVHFWQRQGTVGNPNVDGPATPTETTVEGVPVDLNNQLLPLPTPPSGDVMGLSTHWTIDPVKGRAYASFEVGAVHSQVVSQLWVCAKSLYGDIPGVRLTFVDDNGNGLAPAGGAPGAPATVDLKSNHRTYWQAPAGASDVTLEWDATRATGVLAPYLVWK